jgi:2,4-dienoyl-CoA reductase (NADPH2)
MNAAEFNHPLATTIDEGAEMAKLVAQVADGLNLRSERYGHRGGLQQPDRILYPEPPVDLPQGLDWSRNGRGATVPLVEAVKAKGVTIPVWTACRLDQDLGEMFLRRGSIDFVAMTRRLLADPDLPNKIKEGRPEDIRVCHGCLHCFDCRNKNKLIECRVNAQLGRELDPQYQPRPVERRKKVLVVGGGPAGMEAARVAAERGHEVALYERDSKLGGLVPVAAIVKHLETQDMVDHLRYMETQLRKLNVRVHKGAAVTAGLIRAERPDVLVIAAGASHTKVDVPGADGRKLIRTEKLHGTLKLALRFFSPHTLARLTHVWMPVKRSVVIMGGTLHGCELAEFLAKRHRGVTIAHDGPAKDLGQGMTVDDLENLWPWFKLKKVTVWSDAAYLGIIPKGLEIQVPDKRVFVLEGKKVIATQDWGPSEKLNAELAGLAPETYVVGSAREPGWIVDAVREGALAGYSM